nr:PREDICTED: endocuticle structural glycoprotein SgAbd-1-like [Bemisia tabaci]
MKTILVSFLAVLSVASAQKFFFSDAPTAPAGVPASLAPAAPGGGPLVPGVPGGPLVPGLPGFPATPLQQQAPAVPANPSSFSSFPSNPSIPSFPSQSVPTTLGADGLPIIPKNYIPIVEHTQVKNSDGSYNLRYETANGIAQQEASAVTLNAKGEPIVAKTGSYGYTAPDGTPVSISYIADEHGFRVSGNPLPVAPQPVAAPAAPGFF